jgi:two-component system, OmpR family, response regulator VanR
MIQNILLLKDKTIVYAEDDIITRNQTAEILEMLFGKVYVASDGEEAYNLYEDESPDILLTDVKMPRKDGLSLIRRIRQNDYHLPIILMTSYAEQEMLLNAANLSIDGYLVKPVDLEKLTYSICRAVQRTGKDEGLIVLGKKLYYNSATKELYRNSTIVVLGVKELDLLELLLKNRHRTLTKEEIGKALWPLDPICESAIKNIVLRLRKKIELDIIISVRGVGYRLDTRQVPRPSL